MKKIVTQAFALRVRAYQVRTGTSIRGMAEHFKCSKGTIQAALKLASRIQLESPQDPPRKSNDPRAPRRTDGAPKAHTTAHSLSSELHSIDDEEHDRPDLQRIIISHLAMANHQARAAFKERDMAKLATAQKLAISCVTLMAKLTPEAKEDAGVYITNEKLLAWGQSAREKLKDYARRGEKLPARCPVCGHCAPRSAFVRID